MCKFIGKSNEQILCKLSKSEILRLYSIVHVAMETTKTSHFTCQSKSFISIFFTCQVSAGELQPFSCHDLANEINSHKLPKLFHWRDWGVGTWQKARLNWQQWKQFHIISSLLFIQKLFPSNYCLKSNLDMSHNAVFHSWSFFEIFRSVNHYLREF